MSEQEQEIQLEGIIRASRRDPAAEGKQFLGAAIECSDGTRWVISYDEQSPFHAFADRHVVVTGQPYKPGGQHLIGWSGGQKLCHFRVSDIRLTEAEIGGGFMGHRWLPFSALAEPTPDDPTMIDSAQGQGLEAS